MLSKILSATLIGIDAHIVEVEVDITSKGLPHFSTVGLPDAAVKESKDRVRTALKNTGFNFPLKQITVNLAPADIKKEGSAFDLPIAIGITVAEEILDPDSIKGYMISGELSLDGKIKSIKGALSMALKARDKKLKGLLLPKQNEQEAAVVNGIPVYGFESLPELIEFLRGENVKEAAKVDINSLMEENSLYQEDFSDVKGQEHVKRALEIAATGGHNLLMIGPPGSGKTMLARRIPTILPEMTFEEALQTTRIHSSIGLLNNGRAIIATRPFRSPHHTLSDVAMVGGGAFPKPGEVSLTHNGILFLDELPEFKRNVLEVLRQPLEDGYVTISRALTSVTYPASIMLICAMNPCQCGYSGDTRHQCTCSPYQIQRYRQKVSGPLLDRIDIHIEVPAVPYKDLSDEYCGEPSIKIRQRLKDAREVQVERFRKSGIYSNSKMRTRHIRKYCILKSEAQGIIETAMEKLGLSARAYTRILKVSRTIADLEGSEHIEAEHISEAIQYRTLDRGMF
ncbi:MAG: YifB family Mg chelatase-like AAA ATPase [Nitrospira sp.]|nr:YifB family Mg chelatase-like AAA ATPase [Nitrospira sp.]